MSDIAVRGIMSRTLGWWDPGGTEKVSRYKNWPQYRGVIDDREVMSIIVPEPKVLAIDDVCENLYFQVYSPTVFATQVLSVPRPEPPPEVPPGVMEELAAVQDEAREEGYPVPSDALVEDTRALLGRLYRAAPLGYTIYSMENGEIAIHASNEPTGAVVITCLPHDTWCVVSIGKSRRRAWFQDMAELPDPFTLKALKDLHGAVQHP